MAGMQHEHGAMPGMESELPGQGEAGTPQVDVQYTCPMHPEVVQAAPGSCPKCGMTLEPVQHPPHKHEERDR
jgi:hypothetical protein